jgi:hypothetical protein
MEEDVKDKVVIEFYLKVTGILNSEITIDRLKSSFSI